MKTMIDLPGTSGESYRFRRLDDVAAAPATAGNFAYVRWDRQQPVILYLGEADSLSAVQARWAEAKATHQASDVFVRLNVGRETRQREHDDLLRQARPVMNGAASAEG